MIIDLDTINRWLLEPIGLLLIVHSWDGRGERKMPRDRTRLELMTAREYERRCEVPA